MLRLDRTGQELSWATLSSSWRERKRWRPETRLELRDAVLTAHGFVDCGFGGRQPLERLDAHCPASMSHSPRGSHVDWSAPLARGWRGRLNRIS
jgi:hypothetical protein